MSKTITLSTGLATIVDDEDFDRLNAHRWRIHVDHWGNVEVRRTNNKEKKGGTIIMSREIMQCPANMVVDHIDGNPLDNRRQNLRVCTRTENSRNRRLSKNNTSGYKGVSRCLCGWQAVICVNRTRIYLGSYKTPELAAEAYNRAAQEYFGAFARFNVVPSYSEYTPEPEYLIP